jgi:hypothetical protein
MSTNRFSQAAVALLEDLAGSWRRHVVEQVESKKKHDDLWTAYRASFEAVGAAEHQFIFDPTIEKAWEFASAVAARKTLLTRINEHDLQCEQERKTSVARSRFVEAAERAALGDLYDQVLAKP